MNRPRRRCCTALAVATLALSGVSGMDKSRPPYPATKSEPNQEDIHGVAVVDPYRWLEYGDSPAVKEWTEQQNALTRSFLSAFPGRDKIRGRLDELTQIGQLGVPRPAKGRYFFTRRDGTQNQPVLYIRDSVNGPDRVLLDINALAKDGTTALDWHYPSPDGRLLAYGLSVGGSEQSTLRVRDVATGQDRPDTIERTRACSLAWLPDNSGFYYTRYPAPGSVPDKEETYHRHVYFHRLGDDPAKDEKVFGTGRPKEDWPNINISPDGRWLVTTQQQGWAKTELYLADRTQKPLTFRPVVEGINAIFQPDVLNDRLLIRTNENALNYKLYRVDPKQPDRAKWVELIPERKDAVLENATAIGDHLAVQYMQRAASQLVLARPDGTTVKQVDLPTIGTVTGIGGEWDGRELFYGFQSFTMPTSVTRIDLTNLTAEVWGRVKADIDFDAFEVRQVEYSSKDGTQVSMFVASKKDTAKNRQNPTLLYGYGGFNISLTPGFAASRFLFLERGGVLAVANLRGGGEYGEAWHKAGMLGQKQNVFDDFIGAAEYLIREKVTSPDRLAIQGGSNGGLLVGAAATQRPDLFRAVVCQVPLLDMVRYHLFQIARLWIPEYGSAEDPAQFKWLYSYSPYHSVKDGTRYPAMLILAAETDTRVDPLHARKFAARVQAASDSDRPILLRIETKAGHGAGKPRAKQLDELTDVYSFLFGQLGMSP